LKVPAFLSRIFRSNESRTSEFTAAVAAFLKGDDTLPIATASGATVTEKSSLGLTAIYSAVKLIAWTLASLPLPVYKRLTPRGKERAPNHPNYKLLHDTPNPEITSFKWRELMSAHQNLWGAGISEIEFDASGRPIALWPLPPWRVEPKMTENKTILYKLHLDTGGFRILSSYQVLVFPALSCSNHAWMSPIATHRETIGAAMAVREFGARTFGQGTNPSGILKHPGRLKETSEEDIRKKFKESYEGLSKAHRLMLLEDGMTFEKVGLPAEDAQYLETRKFDVSEIARIFNVPLHLLQDHEKSTSWGSGIEEMNLGFVTFTLRPYLVQWEQEIQRRLFDGDEYFAEFLIEGLLRGKTTERYNAYQIGRQNGWLSANDIREFENMNPLEGDQGDIYLVPLNFQNAIFAIDRPPKDVPPEKKENSNAQ
jgi:HK97 family phage portal protein